MPAREYFCKVIGKIWLTPSVVELRFDPSRKFKFEPGQFLSVVVPAPVDSGDRAKRRAYSLVTPPKGGFGLCVKVVDEGLGSKYIASLEIGDHFRAFAAYGDFVFDHESPRGACFVSTSTGIAPLLSMMSSKAFQDDPPVRAISIFGARTENEIILPGKVASLGVQEVHVVSQPGVGFTGFRGRVTDYLNQLPASWPWYDTDFYLCGRSKMVAEVRAHLRARGVPEARVFQDVYFTAKDRNVLQAASPPMQVKRAG